MKHDGFTGVVLVGYHWWKQAGCNHYSLLDITQFRWVVADNKCTFDWNSSENLQNTRERVDLLWGCSGPICPCIEETDSLLGEEENAEDDAQRRVEVEDIVKK